MIILYFMSIALSKLSVAIIGQSSGDGHKQKLKEGNSENSGLRNIACLRLAILIANLKMQDVFFPPHFLRRMTVRL